MSTSLFPCHDESLVVVSRASGTQRFERACGDSWFAVGDAAFALDPLSGEGDPFRDPIRGSGCERVARG